jgi:hypothetical protein
MRRLCPQQPIATKAGLKISVIFQSVTGKLRASQIWPHLPVLVLCSLLRYAASTIPTILSPAMPTRHSGTGSFAAEMKEYDA